MSLPGSLLLVPLFKIPVIATAVGLHYESFSSPNPPPSDRERTGIFEKTILRSIAFETRMQKGLTTAVGLAEATVLLALAFPRLVPTKVVNLLTYAPSPTSAIYADSLHSPALFASDSPSSLIPFALGTGLVIGGCLLRKWCFTTMGNMFTFEIKVQEEHRLVTWGPYAYVRHPSYTGLIMIFAGLGIWQASPGSWIRESGVLETTVGRVFAGFAALWNATMAAAFIARVPTEDRMLRSHFGPQWEAWAKKVRYRIIPYVY